MRLILAVSTRLSGAYRTQIAKSLRPRNSFSKRCRASSRGDRFVHTQRPVHRGHLTASVTLHRSWGLNCPARNSMESETLSLLGPIQRQIRQVCKGDTRCERALDGGFDDVRSEEGK
jgi:hypothetical protein